MRDGQRKIIAEGGWDSENRGTEQRTPMDRTGNTLDHFPLLPAKVCKLPDSENSMGGRV